MMNKILRGLLVSAFVAPVCLAISSDPAFAYIDPGTGGAIASAIVGVIAAVGYTYRAMFQKVKAFLAGGKAEKRDKDDREEAR